MCSVCGCNEVSPDGQPHHQHPHSHPPSAHRPSTHAESGSGRSHDGHAHPHHGSAHHHSSAQTGDGGGRLHTHHHDHYGAGAAGLSVPGFTQERLIEIEQDILSRNDVDAAANRSRLASRGVLALNLMSSPGAGKTTLLVETITALARERSVGVIEGDQETSNDAERIRTCGVPAVQINTGRGCHLDAHMVGHALDELPLEAGGMVFIENVGNLVCPASFDLGEACKVVILSVTAGDDKPLKYPDMFSVADLMLLSKTDLLPYVDFDPERALEFARRVNPHIEEIRLSARTGEGMAAWLDWLRERAVRHASEAGAARAPDASRLDPAHA